MTRYIDAARSKAKALRFVVQIRGQKVNDRWRMKRPNKFVQQAEDKIKLKTILLETEPEEFPGLRHPSGCSLQYIATLAYLLGDDGKDAWYRKYINPYAEGVVESPYDIVGLLAKARKVMKR
jgi:hypothetical protein